MDTAQLIGENVKFTKKNSGLTPRSKFSTGETQKPTRNDVKILRGELTNTLRRRKNTYTRLTQKKRNG